MVWDEEKAEFSTLTENYSKWLKAQKVKFLHQTEIKDLRDINEGRGIISLDDIETGEVIFEIPRSIIFNLDTCTLLVDRPELRDELVHLNQWEVLIIILLYEFQVKDGASKWRDYFKVLPIFDKDNYLFNQLMFWSDEELEELKPSLIIQRVGKDLADGMYKKLFPKIIVEDMKIVELKDITPQQYHEVASLIMSYSFDIEKLNSRGFVDGDEDDEEEEEEEEEVEEEEVFENGENGENQQNGQNGQNGHSNGNGQISSPISDEEYPDSIEKDNFLKAMIPLADTLNADTNLHNASLEYKADKLVIRAIKPIKKGDQIYNTYSDHPNSEILRRYGYTEIFGSKHDFGEIPLSTIKSFYAKDLGDKFFDEIVQIFKEVIELEDDEDIVDFVLDSYDCFITGDVIIELIILLQCLTILTSIDSISSMKPLSRSSKFQLVRRIYRKCIQLIESQKLTSKTKENFNTIIKSRMDQYPTFASDDFTKDFKYNRKSMAKIVLQSEFKSLQACYNNDKVFQFNNTTYSFIDDDKLVRNIVKRKFDFPIIEDKSKRSRK